MGFKMSPRTVEYGDHMKIRGSGTEVDVARRRWSADEARAPGEDLQAGDDVVKNAKGSLGVNSA